MTLRQLVWMGESRRRSDWDHTAQLCAVIASVFGGSKGRRSARDFHPFRDEPERASTFEDAESTLRILFPDAPTITVPPQRVRGSNT